MGTAPIPPPPTPNTHTRKHTPDKHKIDAVPKLQYIHIQSLHFFIKNYKFFVVHNFKGHNISLSRCAPLQPSPILPIYNVI